MKLYSVIKRHGQWAVRSEAVIVSQFETYDEAIGTAQSAAEILSCQETSGTANYASGQLSLAIAETRS